MSDDLTVMGIAATAAAAMGREQIVLAHQAEHPLAGNPDVATDPKPSPDLAVALALPGRCLQVGFFVRCADGTVWAAGRNANNKLGVEGGADNPSVMARVELY